VLRDCDLLVIGSASSGSSALTESLAPLAEGLLGLFMEILKLARKSDAKPLRALRPLRHFCSNPYLSTNLSRAFLEMT
jgi:hypothetical protein